MEVRLPCGSICPQEIGNAVQIEIVAPCDCYMCQLLKENGCDSPSLIRYNDGNILWFEPTQVALCLCNYMIGGFRENTCSCIHPYDVRLADCVNTALLPQYVHRGTYCGKSAVFTQKAQVEVLGLKPGYCTWCTEVLCQREMQEAALVAFLT